MPRSAAPPPGALVPPPPSAPRWRRGSWPLWLAAVMWILLVVRDVPSLVQGLSGQDPSSAAGPATLLGLALLLAAALGVAALAPGRLTSAHLMLHRPTVLGVATVTVLSIAALYGVVWLGSVVSATPNQDTSFGMGKDLASDVMLVLAIGAIGPVAEEFAYRAVLLRAVSDGLARWLNPKPAAAIGVGVSSAVFASAHTGAPGWHLLAYFAFGTVLALGVWWTGSLYVAAIPHLLNNSYAAVTMALAAHASPTVVAVAVAGPVLGLALMVAVGLALPRPS